MIASVAHDVHSSLLTAIAQLRQAEKNAVLLFGRVLSEKLFLELGYSTIHQYAVEALGFSAPKTSQFITMVQSLEKLPELKKAVCSGEIDWTKVATARSEKRWIQEARTSTSRMLEKKVRAARKQSRRPQAAQLDLAPTPEPLPDDAPVSWSVTFSAEQFARFEALMETLRKKGHRQDRAELMLSALAALVADEKEASSAPSYHVTVSTCPDCQKSVAHTTRGDLPINTERVTCDAILQTPGKPNRATIPPRIRRSALQRANHRCQTPGCTHTRFLEVHHIIPRSRGGTNSLDNLQVLCSACHALAHRRAVVLRETSRPYSVKPVNPVDIFHVEKARMRTIVSSSET